MGREVLISAKPKRIISLVPSQTELLYDLGLDEEIVGQTLFCIHPSDKHKTKPRVGGTKKLNMEAIHRLQPDLIIGNKEENERTQIEELAKKYPVWMSDISTIAQAVEMMKCLGEITDTQPLANALANNIQQALQDIYLNQQMPATNKKVLYLIWRQPWMAAGKDTFISEMMHHCGWQNALNLSRYPILSPDEIAGADTDCIFLSSEPYPFSQKHIDEIQQMSPQASIYLVDGESFSWYGSRLLKSIDYLKALIDKVNHDS
jgi:ABC-type Fe3+-hydroxamate transport system substrate-binding protein